MLGTAATNCTTLTEWDGPLLLCRHIFSHNGGVKQNICGALHILLENQFRSFFLLAFIFNIFLTYIFFRKNMQSDQRSEWSETITADDERESKTRTSIERFSLHFGSSRKEWYPPAPFSPLAPDFLIQNFFFSDFKRKCMRHARRIRYFNQLRHQRRCSLWCYLRLSYLPRQIQRFIRFLHSI